MPFLHHGKRPRYTNYEKFKLPRKRANIMMTEITNEAIEKSKASKPEVWNTHFRVGDAIEIEQIMLGGNVANRTEKIRGVVMGIYRKKMDYSILIRESLFLWHYLLMAVSWLGLHLTLWSSRLLDFFVLVASISCR